MFTRGILVTTKDKQKVICAKDQTTCGSEDVGQTVFCIPKGRKCPITHLFIGTSAPDDNYDQKIKLGGDGELYISREIDAYPILQIRVTQGQGVCLRNDVLNEDENNPFYALQ